MGLEILALLGAAGLGIWAILSEPTCEVHQAYTEYRDQELAQAEADELAAIDNSIALLTVQLLGPDIGLQERHQLEELLDQLELQRRQYAAEELGL